jgi:hypothetical protein
MRGDAEIITEHLPGTLGERQAGCPIPLAEPILLILE